MVLTFMREKTGFNKTANKNPIPTKHLIKKKRTKNEILVLLWNVYPEE